MAINNFPSLCPTDCDGVLNYPAIEADQNCTDFDLYESQLTDLWLKPLTAADAPFTDWPVVGGDYTITPNPTAIDNSVTDNSKVKWLVGSGGVPVPDKTIEELPKFKDRTSKRTYTFTFTDPNVSDAKYEFGRALQCGSTSFTFWYATLSHVFGDADGITPKSVDVDFPLDEGRDGKMRMVITITFEAKVDPERRIKPVS